MKDLPEQIDVDVQSSWPPNWWCYLAGYSSVGCLGAWACSTPAALACSGGWYSGWMPGDFCWRRLGAWPCRLLTSLLAAGMLLAGPVSAQGGPVQAFEPGVQVVVVAQVEAAPESLPPLENGPVACRLDTGQLLNETGSCGCAIGVDDVAAGSRRPTQAQKAPVLKAQRGRDILTGTKSGQTKKKHDRQGTGVEITESVFTQDQVKGFVDDWLVGFLADALMIHMGTGSKEG